MEKKCTFVPFAVVASLIGAPALAEDRPVQPKLEPSADAVEFCKELSKSSLLIDTPLIKDVPCNRNVYFCPEREQCIEDEGLVDAKIERSVEISVDGIRIRIKCVYEKHAPQKPGGSGVVFFDDIPASTIEINPRPDSDSFNGTNADKLSDFGNGFHRRNGRSIYADGVVDSASNKYGIRTVTPEDQKRFVQIMKAAREALRSATSSSDR